MSQGSPKKNILKPAIEHAGLFDKIILAITTEKELRQTKKLFFLFVSLLLISIASLPFSFVYFMRQWENSGVFYFIDIIFSNTNAFFAFWQDFLLSVAESLPVLGIILFATNVALLLFTVRLFLHRRGLLLKYLKNHELRNGQ